MPRYTYKCTNTEDKCEKCNTIVEEFRTIEDRNKEKLCECGAPLERVTELNSSPKFKGDGFTPKFY